MKEIVIYWCRRDFRLHDNPALWEAVDYAKKQHIPFLPLYILDDHILASNTKEYSNVGYPRRLFLSRALAYFSQQFEHFSITTGQASEIFDTLTKAYKLYVFTNEDVEPYALARDRNISEIVTKQGGIFQTFADQLTVNKNTVTSTGNLYSVFTPFKNTVWNDFVNAKIYDKVDVRGVVYSDSLAELQEIKGESYEQLQQAIFKLIDVPWTCRISSEIVYNLDELFERKTYEQWSFKEEEIIDSFNEFVKNDISNYATARDDLGLEASSGTGVSKMSVALKWGLVSSRFLKQIIIHNNTLLSLDNGQTHYINELIWREFYRYLLFHNPDLLDTEFQPKYRNLPNLWVSDERAQKHFSAWIKGETGYALVDAGMKQIVQEGWMHNRLRMVVGSILTKNLGVNWRWGQEFFRSTLLDLDEASNNGGWQWAASVGADPKPIRIFNPYLQADNYDKNGLFCAKYLGNDYNIQPIIEHAQARQNALQRYGLDKKS